jgi:hypothetical protein
MEHKKWKLILMILLLIIGVFNMVLSIGYSMFSGRMFSNSPNDNEVLGFDGNTQRPGPPGSFFSGFSESKFPVTMVEDSSVGDTEWYWSAPVTNLGADDGNEASAALSGGEISYYAKCTNFGFNIPSGAIIKGIKVTTEKQRSGEDANIFDYEVKIIKNGSIMTTNKAAAGVYATDWTKVYYGSSTDLWGETWTADEINYDNFGVVISVQNTGGAGNDGQIDYVSITVYYSA